MGEIKGTIMSLIDVYL